MGMYQSHFSCCKGICEVLRETCGDSWENRDVLPRFRKSWIPLVRWTMSFCRFNLFTWNFALIICFSKDPNILQATMNVSSIVRSINALLKPCQTPTSTLLYFVHNSGTRYASKKFPQFGESSNLHHYHWIDNSMKQLNASATTS